jgi:anti-sigma factor ChrR (cupin superfamily)
LQADWRLSSAPQSRPAEIQVDEIRKMKKKWNGAGTFRSLVTLKEDDDVKHAAEGSCGVS